MKYHWMQVSNIFCWSTYEVAITTKIHIHTTVRFHVGTRMNVFNISISELSVELDLTSGVKHFQTIICRYIIIKILKICLLKKYASIQILYQSLKALTLKQKICVHTNTSTYGSNSVATIHHVWSYRTLKFI